MKGKKNNIDRVASVSRLEQQIDRYNNIHQESDVKC